jgi:hypothetical protein
LVNPIREFKSALGFERTKWLGIEGTTWKRMRYWIFGYTLQMVNDKDEVLPHDPEICHRIHRTF